MEQRSGATAELDASLSCQSARLPPEQVSPERKKPVPSIEQFKKKITFLGPSYFNITAYIAPKKCLSSNAFVGKGEADFFKIDISFVVSWLSHITCCTVKHADERMKHD